MSAPEAPAKPVPPAVQGQLSLRHHLIVRLGMIMLCLAAISSVVVYHLSLRFSDEAYDEWLLDSARSLSFLVREREGHVQVELPSATLRAMVWDANDLVLFRIDSEREGFIAGQHDLKFVPANSNERVSYGLTNAEGRELRVVRIVRRDLVPGDTIAVTVGETLHKRHRLASRVLGTVMAVSGVLALLSILLARDAVTRGLRPLVDLAQGIQRRPKGDLTRLPDTRMTWELQSFTHAINELLEQLDEAVAWQRRFVADAAHQLRTPLAALKVELEHALRESDPARHQQALQHLQGGIDRLSRITQQLLTLARSEPGALSTLSFKVLDLSTLARDAAQRFIPLGLKADIDLGFEGPDGGDASVPVRGDALLLEQAVGNLVDNALRYAGRGTTVTVRVGTTVAEAWVTVEDNGPGVPEAALPRLTERFHRLQDSPGGGSGLGLAIVQEIARLHGGDLTLARVVPHGLAVTMRLPLATWTAPPG